MGHTRRLRKGGIRSEPRKAAFGFFKDDGRSAHIRSWPDACPTFTMVSMFSAFICRKFGHRWDGCTCGRCSLVRNEGHDWLPSCLSCRGAGYETVSAEGYSGPGGPCPNCKGTRVTPGEYRCGTCGAFEHR